MLFHLHAFRIQERSDFVQKCRVSQSNKFNWTVKKINVTFIMYIFVVIFRPISFNMQKDGFQSVWIVAMLIYFLLIMACVSIPGYVSKVTTVVSLQLNVSLLIKHVTKWLTVVIALMKMHTSVCKYLFVKISRLNN